MFGIYKAGKSGDNARMKWIEAKREEIADTIKH
jgi:hypothetical protein